MDKTLKLYSTPRLAEAIGVSLVTIYRWVAAGKIKSQGPSYPHGDGVVMFWTEADVANARKVKAEQRPGPKVKKASKDRLAIARQPECEGIMSRFTEARTRSRMACDSDAISRSPTVYFPEGDAGALMCDFTLIKGPMRKHERPTIRAAAPP